MFIDVSGNFSNDLDNDHNTPSKRRAWNRCTSSDNETHKGTYKLNIQTRVKLENKCIFHHIILSDYNSCIPNLAISQFCYTQKLHMYFQVNTTSEINQRWKNGAAAMLKIRQILWSLEGMAEWGFQAIQMSSSESECVRYTTDAETPLTPPWKNFHLLPKVKVLPCRLGLQSLA